MREKRTEKPAFFVPAGVLVSCMITCGGQTSGDDAGADARSHRDAGSDRQLSGGDAQPVGDGASEADVTTEAEAAPDGGKPFYGGGNFASCAMNPCGSDQVCLNYLPTSGDGGIEYANCQTIPKACEPHPTCFCLIEMEAVCSNRTCSDEGGAPVVTCTVTPHP